MSILIELVHTKATIASKSLSTPFVLDNLASIYFCACFVGAIIGFIAGIVATGKSCETDTALKLFSEYLL